MLKLLFTSRFFRSATLSILISFGCTCQELIKSIPIELGRGDKLNFFNYNKNTGNTLMLIAAGDELQIIELDSSYNVISQIRKTLAYDFEGDLVGTAAFGSTYYFYFKEMNQVSFKQIRYDAQTQKVSIHSNLTPLTEDEVSLGYFLSGNELINIGIVRRTSQFTVGRITEDVRIKHKTFDLSQSEFLKDYKDLFRFFKKNDAAVQNSEFTVPTLSDSTRNSFAAAHFKAKMYLYGEKCIFTFDNELEKTKILTLNLTDGSTVYKEILHAHIPRTMCAGTSASSYEGRAAPVLASTASCSVISGDLLYRAYACSEYLSFQVHNFKTGEVIKEYGAKRTGKIDFANTPIMRKGMSDKSNAEENGNTSKFLSKISFNDAVLTAYNHGDGTVEIKLGSYFEQPRGGGGGMMMMGGAPGGGGMIMMPMYYGNIGRGWKDDKNFISFFVKSLFDKEGNHIDGPIARKDINVEIDKYVEESDLNMDAEDIVKIGNDTYLFGYYIKKEKKYFLYKFKE